MDPKQDLPNECMQLNPYTEGIAKEEEWIPAPARFDLDEHRTGVRLCITTVWSKAWVEYAKRHDLMDKPAARLYASYHDCSDHFTVHDFNPGRTRLTKTAVPSVRPQEHWQSVICRAISRASTPSFRKSAVRPKDVIKRLQAKVSRYRKAITRLRKQEQKAPRTATEALAMIRPHVTEEIDSLISIIFYSTLAVYKKEVAEFFDDLPEMKSLVEFNDGEIIAYIVIGVIGFIVSSLCVGGAYTDQRHYILPYLVFDFLVLGVQAIIDIWLIFVDIINGATQDLSVVCFRVLWLFLWCYFFAVVLSFYKQLANAANKPGVPMVPAAHSASPGTYVPPRSYSPAAPEPQYYSDSKMSLV
ncbi:hypothetical protein HPB47_018420 [Ixodes persulcatus]|uniref:Uncharacterized protein n=1 Tax=Ixodes persulcatus TaxID=34615 RepID=A0AC60QKS5_IXOPE|nr:hypothetical protein HPB47_018420 [Ixodes persulcatus]